MGEKSELEALRLEFVALREMVSRLVSSTLERPRAYEFKAAAKLLSVDPKTISRMVKCGELLTIELRGKRLIPVEEIDRVTTPPSMKSNTAAPEQRLRLDRAKAQKAIEEAMRKR